MKNRVIKFRFWSGEKMFFDLPNVMECLKQQMAFDGGVPGLITYDHIGLHGGCFDQFTGLKDKNGVEIYESDLIDLFWSFTGASYKCKVLWHQSFGRWAMQELPDGIYHYFGSQDTNLMDIEIIGNIHQHEHLLK